MNPLVTNLVDLIVLVLVIAAVVRAARRGSGLLGIAGSALGTLLICWLAAGAVMAWGPHAAAHATSASRFAHLISPPTAALAHAGTAVHHLLSAAR